MSAIRAARRAATRPPAGSDGAGSSSPGPSGAPARAPFGSAPRAPAGSLCSGHTSGARRRGRPPAGSRCAGGRDGWSCRGDSAAWPHAAPGSIARTRHSGHARVSRARASASPRPAIHRSPGCRSHRPVPGRVRREDARRRPRRCRESEGRGCSHGDRARPSMRRPSPGGWRATTCPSRCSRRFHSRSAS